MKARNHLARQDVDGRILLEWVLKVIWCEGVDCIWLTQHSVQWRTLVMTVTKRRVPLKSESTCNRWATISFSRRVLFHGVSFILTTASFVLMCLTEPKSHLSVHFLWTNKIGLSIKFALYVQHIVTTIRPEGFCSRKTLIAYLLPPPPQ
jgi:hypothetical protein